MGITAGTGEAGRSSGIREGPLDEARVAFTRFFVAKIGGLRPREPESNDDDEDLGRVALVVLVGLSGKSERPSPPSVMTVSGGVFTFVVWIGMAVGP